MTNRIHSKVWAVLLAALLVFSCWGLEWLSPEMRAVTAPAAKTDGSVSLPVLMYHHILESSSRLGDYVISPQQFEADLQFLSVHGYQTVTVQDILHFVQTGGPLPEKPVLITFDDGYESTYAYAFPLLKKYGMTAVVSIIGSYTELFSNPDEPRHLNYSHLSWEQLREMLDSGVFEVGNHTTDMHKDGVNGKRYGIRIKKGETKESYRSALLTDIGGLNDRMAEELGMRPSIFAYPFGALCKESKPILNELGFSVILTCEEKVNTLTPQSDMPLVLKRFNRAHRYTSEQYFAKLGIKE